MKDVEYEVTDGWKAIKAESVADWLVQYKGLPEESRENVTSNLREAFKNWELKGRLDRAPAISIECPADGSLTISLTKREAAK